MSTENGEAVVKLLKSWLGTLKPEQRTAIDLVLTDEQKAQLKALTESAEPSIADIKKFIGSIKLEQLPKIAGKLTGPQLTQVFALKKSVK